MFFFAFPHLPVGMLPPRAKATLLDVWSKALVRQRKPAVPKLSLPTFNCRAISVQTGSDSLAAIEHAGHHHELVHLRYLSVHWGMNFKASDGTSKMPKFGLGFFFARSSKDIPQKRKWWFPTVGVPPVFILDGDFP